MLAGQVYQTLLIECSIMGIGGNAGSNAADGSYLITLDLDGNGVWNQTRDSIVCLVMLMVIKLWTQKIRLL